MQSLWQIRDPGVLARWADNLRAHGRLRRWGHRAEIDAPSPSVVHLVANGAVHSRDSDVRIGRGDLFGVRTERVALRAYDDTVILEVSQEALSNGLGELQSSVGLVSPKLIAVPVNELLYTTGAGRLVKTLLHIAKPREDGLWAIEVELKARHLSQLTGMPVLATRRIFKTLQERHLVQVGRNGLVIPDIAAIEAVLEQVDE